MTDLVDLTAGEESHFLLHTQWSNYCTCNNLPIVCRQAPSAAKKTALSMPFASANVSPASDNSPDPL